MRFRLLDKITELHVGRSITATKRLDADEDYLKDHFPKFPVMPGVLMLEAMFQASAWLVRVTDDFEHPFVLLQEARSVKYASFLAPDQVLTVLAEVSKHEPNTTKLKVSGTVDGVLAVSGRLVLERFKLSDRYPHNGSVDAWTRHTQREELAKLWNHTK
ncbi:MAG: beta-hydroxyacyl-ACP dehydratase [Planctomycetaceae bacterium]|nr:beta-hydroxyacyl-ACP dehydratase [Planctomycetales bacterium]MCB9925874.1 beta-hydroxyacyl-ACP dehydratase [Planctomycetaceae bacterium]